MSDPRPGLKSRIERDYSYPKQDWKFESFAAIRDDFKRLSLLMVDVLPVSREMDECLRSIEQAAMWANAAIARSYESKRPQAE